MNLLRTGFFIAFFLLFSSFIKEKNSFEETQKSFNRVNYAYKDKEETIRAKCRSLGISETNFGDMFIRVFKQERILELWVRNTEGKYVLYNEFRVYSNAGKLGPKRAQGDYQVPEGFYYITNFNPQSTYYLSLGINYPNESDCKLSKACQKGGNIYIHGSVVSSGCLAMSDYYIEDIYVCCVKARNQGQQKIPVHIYPFKMTEQNLESFTQLEEFKKYKKFWQNLKDGYEIFEKNCCPPEIGIGEDGYYQFYPLTAAVRSF